MKSQGSTKASGVVGALLFAEHVLGWEAGADVNKDPRIRGFTVEQISRMPARKQAALLECADFVLLEKVLFCEQNLNATEVVILGGYLLLATFRSRFSDLASCMDIIVEGMWLVAYPEAVKTSGPRLDREPLVLLGRKRLFS